jgi:4-hydroxybenzoate polyprenyltransferase
MSLNRLLDRHIDAENPRTAGRAIPAGLISVKEVWVYTILSFALLIISSLMLNMLAVKLMPIAVFFLVIYSYMKRISWTCHLVLGIAIGLAPMGSWVAVTGTLELPALLMGLAVATWVAGFDVVYACQDYKYDKEKGLHSIPSRFGIPSALIIAKVLHILAVILLASVGLSLNLGLFYWVGVLIAALILVYEHRIVNPRDLSKINIAFFNMNGILSVIVLVFTLLDLFL